MKFINSKVYENGVTATLNKNYFIALTATGENGSEIIATSACIGNGSAVNGYLGKKITWKSNDKKIVISPFLFEETKSIISNDTTKTATGFSLIELDGVTYKASDNASAAYEGSTPLYKWPVINDSNRNVSDKIMVISGDLSTQIDITKDNNFKFREVDIVFSEGA